MSVTALHPYTLGGSDIPALLGLDPWVSPYALACRKLGVTSDPEPSVAARLGLALEGAHLDLLRAEGREVHPFDGLELVDEALPWLVGHPDAFEREPDAAPPIELKLRGVAPSDETRMRDTVQALTYAYLLSAPRAYVSTLHGGFGGFKRDEFVVDYDAELWAMIVDRCEQFLDLLRRGKCPAPDGSRATRDAIRERYADANEHRRVRLTAGQMEALWKVRELDETIKAAESQRERYAQVVQDAMGDAVEAVSPHDAVVARWKPVTSRRLDTTRLRRDHPALASEYERETTTRRFEANP